VAADGSLVCQRLTANRGWTAGDLPALLTRSTRRLPLAELPSGFPDGLMPGQPGELTGAIASHGERLW